VDVTNAQNKQHERSKYDEQGNECHQGNQHRLRDRIHTWLGRIVITKPLERG